MQLDQDEHSRKDGRGPYRGIGGVVLALLVLAAAAVAAQVGSSARRPPARSTGAGR